MERIKFYLAAEWSAKNMGIISAIYHNNYLLPFPFLLCKLKFKENVIDTKVDKQRALITATPNTILLLLFKFNCISIFYFK